MGALSFLEGIAKRLDFLNIGRPWSTILLWLLTLIAPFVAVSQYTSYYGTFALVSPTLWTIFSTYSTQFAFFGFIFGAYVYPTFQPVILLISLLMGIFMIIAAIALERLEKGKIKPRTTRNLVLIHPILLLLACLILTISTSSPMFGTMLFIPLPIASLFQFMLYKQYSREGVRVERVLEVPAPTTAVSVSGAKRAVEVLRGGEFVGNKFRYKVKVVNNSEHIIADVTVALLSYPRDTLRLEGESSKTMAKIEPGGFRSPTFDFLPTEDCVKGEVIATVSYLDSRGDPHSLVSEPFVIRAVCDLLEPETITPEQFALKLADLKSGEMKIRVEDWTPEEMHSKTIQVLESSNFSEVSSELKRVGGNIEARAIGWARGVYTGKSIGLEVIITGKPGIKGATCVVQMVGEDEAMIMPAIDEVAHKLKSWLCPICAADLAPDVVSRVKSGETVQCPFCSASVGY